VERRSRRGRLALGPFRITHGLPQAAGIKEFHRKVVGEDFAFRELAKEEFERARALGLFGLADARVG
jgi:hypothetical protein